MLTLPPSVRIFLAPGATDLRKSYDGLFAAVVDVLREDPWSGHVFGFANRARNRVKLLVWDHGGFWLICRRLEVGTLDWPVESDVPCKVVGALDLLALFEGVDLSAAPRRRRYVRPVA